MKAIAGKVSFEKLLPEDLIDAVKTIKGTSATGISYPPIGTGVERQIKWALADLEKATESSDQEEKERCSANALLHARRGLSCLVDSYLRRDGLSLCKGVPKSAEDKNRVLVRRNVLDKTSADVLLDAIQMRNAVEHNYLTVPFHVARTAVELIRRTVDSLIYKSNPANGPCYFGSFGHGTVSNSGNITFAFYGWHGHGCILATFSNPAWIGIVESRSKGKANIRKAYLKDIHVDTILEALDILEKNFKDRTTFLSPILWAGLSREAGMS